MAFVNERFSSPIGDFVIYTKIKRWYEYDRNKVFVPYRGFCYLYKTPASKEEKNMKFSSPIGDFVIYTKSKNLLQIPIGCFRPLSGILLFIPEDHI